MTKDLHVAVLLDAIYYWHLPPNTNPKDHTKTRMKIFKSGCYWIAKQRTDWEDIGLSPKQFDRCIKILKGLNWVNLDIKGKGKNRSMLIHLTNQFLIDWKDFEDNHRNREIIEFPNGKSTELLNSQMGNQRIIEFPNGESKPLLNSQMGNQKLIEFPNGNSLYINSFLKDTLFKEELLEEIFSKNKDEQKRILNQAENFLKELESKQLLLKLKSYKNFWNDIKEFEKLSPIVEHTNSYFSTFFGCGQIVPTDIVFKRMDVVWRELDCNEMKFTYGERKLTAINILMFVLRRKCSDWFLAEVNQDNLDSLLFAMISYYKNHENDYEWPKDE